MLGCWFARDDRGDDGGESGGAEAAGGAIIESLSGGFNLEYVGEMALEIRVFFQQQGIDIFLAPEGWDDDSIGTVLFGDVPAEAGAEVVQQVGACPEVEEFAGGFNEFLDGGEGEQEQVGMGLFSWVIGGGVGEGTDEGGDGSLVAVERAVGKDGVGGSQEGGAICLGAEFGVKAPEPPEDFF